MDMGPPRLIEQPGNKVFIEVKKLTANRANPGPLPIQAVGASVNVHKTIGLAHGGERGGFYPLPLDKPDGTNRTGPGHPGFSL